MTDVRDAIATILDNMTLAQFVEKDGQDAHAIPAGQ
ncbi:UNVERIFIED_ORG: DNA-binding IscR family transcriptional regulator [Rhizobium sp. SORGH_AS260]|jgi:hypothetical protein|nr:DNA-binding IscR family transcriptional regulator [Rhizobium sp. SORGH_AS_0260]